MAKYPAMITTNKGRDLVSRSNATKKAITWTKIVVGDGDNNNIDTLTNVISKKLEITVDKTSDLTNGQWKVQGTIDNSTLTEGFYCKEIAVFAKCEGDTDEILFAYTNGGNYVDYIPDKTTPVDSQKVTCQFVVGNAANVAVTMNNEAYLRREDLNEHDNNENAHTPLLNKWINKSFSKFREAVIGVVKDALTEILDTQIKLDTNGFVRMGFLGGFTIQWVVGTEDGVIRPWALAYNELIGALSQHVNPLEGRYFSLVGADKIGAKIYLGNDTNFYEKDTKVFVLSCGKV